MLVVSILLGVGRAEGCPHCNIYNYLGTSVQSSTNVFVGEVLGQADERTARVKVLQVWRGTHEVGSHVTNPMWQAHKHVGEEFIFSNPTSHGPTFENLPLEFEDEVRFLIQEPPTVNSIEEAIQRVQGVSIVTQEIGMKYIEQHHEAALEPLLAELESLMPQVFSGKETFFGEHRLDGLIGALLVKPTDTGKEFVFSQIDALPHNQPPFMGWTGFAVLVVEAVVLSILLAGVVWAATRLFARRRFPSSFRSFLKFTMIAGVILGCALWYLCPWLGLLPRAPSARGVFLRDMLSQTKKHPELCAAVKEHALEVSPTLSGPTLAETVYAMVLAGLATPEELQTRLKGRMSAEMLALGLYHAGNYQSMWWQHEDAYALWDKAVAIAGTVELKAAINGRIRANERFWKRKER